ncbi:NupC/NupG family nucleoside CNT transporter [Chitinophaga rhizosphaerae]|uniref:NupC/NupG family nucleoside CNT transporter n=1 Tax=Chitinophaga rhizosphaerae TaxID=1864947 RepID=UPI000F8048C1|nr:nucleoside transporter C-terminal domain-containing protein [Chitinophaga rhizosphaerae]
MLHWENIARGALGMSFLVLVCYLLSNNRRAVNWRLVGMGICAQVMFAMGVLDTRVGGQPVFWLLFGILITVFTVRRVIRRAKEGFGPMGDPVAWLLSLAALAGFFFGIVRSPDYQLPAVAFAAGLIPIFVMAKFLPKRNIELLKWTVLAACFLLTISVYLQWCPPDVFRRALSTVSSAFVDLINISHKGTDFMFGKLADPSGSWAYIFAVQVLPNIIFFAALSSILYYLGILQKIVFVFAYLLNKMKISGAESLSTAANIFLGQTEAPLMIRPYLDKMTRSEIMLIMVGGFANTAGSVMAAYVGMLGGTDELAKEYFSLHMLSQSIMSAPAAIVCAKLMFPETQDHLIQKDLQIPKEKLGDNFLDAISLGTTDGLKLAVNVGAMLIVFTAMMYVVNAMLGWVGDQTNLNAYITNMSGGRYTSLSLDMILGYLFSPIAWLIGVASADILAVGQLLGIKTVLNEFLAYQSLSQMKEANVIRDPKSLLIATYALCGFANFASIGIQIGGISQLAPNQRKNLTELGLKALIGGTIACLMCGCIAGALS